MPTEPFSILSAMISGLAMTVSLMCLSALLAFSGGLLIALLRTGWLDSANKHVNRIFRIVSSAWIEVFRNIPLLCLVLFFYYGLKLPGYLSAVLALSGFTSAYVAETFRSGFATVPDEELQGARLMGLNRLQQIRWVLLPRALESIAVALGNQLMNLTKNTAIAYFVAVGDVTSTFEQLTTQTYDFIPYVAFALISYGLLCLGLNHLSKLLENYLLRRYTAVDIVAVEAG